MENNKNGKTTREVVVESSPLAEMLALSHVDAERAVLSMIFDDLTLPAHLSHEYLEEASTLLQPEDFSRPLYETVYKTALEMFGRGLRPDTDDMVRELRKRPGFNDEDALIVRQLTCALFDFSRPITFIDLCLLIQASAARRRILGIIHDSYSKLPHADPADLIEHTREALGRIRTGASGADDTIENVAARYREMLTEWKTNPGALRGTTTGLRGLDKATLGVRRGDLWVIASRPSMGKTSLALAMLLAAARNCDPTHQVAMVSLEMSAESLVHRLVSMMSGLAARAIEEGDRSLDWNHVEGTVEELEILPLRIIDASRAANHANGSRGKMTPAEIRRHALAWNREARLDLIIVDYLELMQVPADLTKERRDIQLGEMVKALKALASELQIPVVLLAQTNREGEHTSSRVPTLAGLRNSDEIGAAADVVLFPVRWDYYRERGGEVPLNAGNRAPGVTDVFIGKQRNGETGAVPIFFAKELMRFVDWDEKAQLPMDYAGKHLPGLSVHVPQPPPKKR